MSGTELAVGTEQSLTDDPTPLLSQETLFLGQLAPTP